MRILHLVHQYMPDKVGGTELYTQTAAQFQIERGDEAAIFTPTAAASQFPEPEVEKGIRLYRVPVGPRSAGQVFSGNFRQSQLSQAWTAVLAQEQPDLVHIQHLMGLPFSLVQQLWRAGIPYLITLHDYYYFCANAQLFTNDSDQICDGPNMGLNCGRCALARAGLPAFTPLAAPLAPLFIWRNRQLRQIAQRARRLIAPTEFVRQLYIKAGFPPEKIQVIGHGIHWPPDLPQAAKTTAKPLHIVYAGGLAWQKGVHLLVTAVNQLPHDAVRLTIAGDPTAFPAYSQSLVQLARHPHIHFPGKLDRRQLWALLAEADVVVVPSLWHETASLIIQEAFAAGTPVIASRVGALPERVNEGVDGLLFPVGDGAALQRLLSQLCGDPDLLAHLRRGIQSPRTVEQHLVELTAVYQEISEQ
jgi:glycosyltransferase involved in cell wall biosynthesis